MMSAPVFQLNAQVKTQFIERQTEELNTQNVAKDLAADHLSGDAAESKFSKRIGQSTLLTGWLDFTKATGRTF